jgi:hypothetical protein
MVLATQQTFQEVKRHDLLGPDHPARSIWLQPSTSAASRPGQDLGTWLMSRRHLGFLHAWTWRTGGLHRPDGGVPVARPGEVAGASAVARSRLLHGLFDIAADQSWKLQTCTCLPSMAWHAAVAARVATEFCTNCQCGPRLRAVIGRLAVVPHWHSLCPLPAHWHSPTVPIFSLRRGRLQGVPGRAEAWVQAHPGTLGTLEGPYQG